MDFIKKNWAKMTLALITFIATIMMLVPLFTTPGATFVAISQILGILLFFLGLTVFFILKILAKDKKDKVALASKCTLVVTGLLSLLFLLIGTAGFNLGIDQKKVEKIQASQAEGKIPSITKMMEVSKSQGAFGSAYGSFYEQMGDIDDTTGKYVDGKKALKKDLSDAKAELKSAKESGNEQSIATAQFYVDAAELQIDRYDAAKTAANTILMTYISLILLMGLVPVVMGSKKLVCHFCCKKDETPSAK